MEFNKKFNLDPDHFLISNFDRLSVEEQTVAKFDYAFHGGKRKKTLRKQSKFGPFDDEFDEILSKKKMTYCEIAKATYNTGLPDSTDPNNEHLHDPPEDMLDGNEDAAIDAIEIAQQLVGEVRVAAHAFKLKQYLGPNLKDTLLRAMVNIKPFTYSKAYMMTKIHGSSGIIWMKYFAVRLLSHCGFDTMFMNSNYAFWHDFYEASRFQKKRLKVVSKKTKLAIEETEPDALKPGQFHRVKICGADYGEIGYISLRCSDNAKLFLINLAFVWPKGFPNPFANTKEKALVAAGFPPSRSKEPTFVPNAISSALIVPEIANQPYRKYTRKDCTFYAQMAVKLSDPFSHPEDLLAMPCLPYPNIIHFEPFEESPVGIDIKQFFGPLTYTVGPKAYCKEQYLDVNYDPSWGALHAEGQMFAGDADSYLPNLFDDPVEPDIIQELPDQVPVESAPLKSQFPNGDEVQKPHSIGDTFTNLFSSIKETVKDAQRLPTRIKDTFSNLETATQKFNTLADKVDTYVTEIKTKFNTLPSFATLFDKIREQFSNVLTALNPFQWVVSCAILALIILYGMSSTSETRALVASSLGLIVGLTIYCHWPTKFKAQSWMTEADMFYKAFQSLGSVLLGVKREFFCFKKFSDFCGNSCKIMAACQKLPEFIIFLQKCWDYLYETYHLFAYGVPSITMSSEFGALFTIAGRMLAKPELYSVNIMITVSAAMDNAIKACGKMGYGPQFDMLVNMAEDLRKQVIKSRENVFSARKGCVPPLVLFMWGESGTGKSSIVSQVAALVSKILIGDNFTSVYYWNPTLNFMDAFFGQAVTVLDDFGQTTDVSGMPSGDFLALIRAKNIAQFIVDKANLEDKGNWIFSSLVLFLTSNTKVFNDGNVKSVTCPSAINRRLDIIMEVTSFDSFSVTSEFGRKVSKTLTTDTIVPYIIEKFAEYYTHEINVYNKIKANLDASIPKGANMAHQLNGDALRSFISWQAIIKDDVNSFSTGKKKFYDACCKVFDRIKKDGKYVVQCSAVDGVSTNLCEQIAEEFGCRKNAGGCEDVMAALHAYASATEIFVPCPKYELPHGGVYATKPHLLKQNPSIYSIYGGQNKFELDLSHNCCVKHDDSYVHKNDIINAENCSELACSLMTERMSDDLYSNVCAFDLIEKDVTPIYLFRGEASEVKVPAHFKQSYLEFDLLLQCYHCDCTVDKKCTRDHKFSFDKLYTNSWIRFLNRWLLTNPYVLTLTKITPCFACHEAPPTVDDTPTLLDLYRREVSTTVNRGHLTLITTVAAITTVILSAVVIYEQTRKWQQTIAQASNPEALQTQRTIARTPRYVPQRVVANGQVSQEAVAQSFCDVRGRLDVVCHDLLPKILTHQCKLVVEQDGKFIPLLNGLFLNPHCILTSYHITLRLKSETRVYIEFLHKGECFDNLSFLWKEAKVERILDTRGEKVVDGIIICLPSALFVPGISTITDKFIRVSDLDKIDGSRVLLCKVNSFANAWTPEIWALPPCHIQKQQMAYEITLKGDVFDYHAHEWIEYDHTGLEGDCGSVGLIINASLKDTGSRIAFMHTFCAASLNMSGGTIFTSEQIHFAMKKFGKTVNYTKNIPDQYAFPVVFEMQCAAGGVLLEGIKRPVPLNYQDFHYPQFTSSESKIILSDIGKLNVLPKTKFPAHMGKFKTPEGVEIDPGILALKKFLKPIHRPIACVLELAVDDYKNVLQGCKRHVLPQIYTLFQAAFGDENIENLKSIDVNTADGQPWKTYQKPSGRKKGKRAWVDLDSKWLHPLLVEVVNTRISKAENLEIDFTIFEDCKKDEKRLPEKVDAGKTRLFSSGPIDLLLAMRMYFGAFVEWFTVNRIHNESGVGLNPQSPEWHVLSKHLLRMGDYQIAGDFSDYDASEVREILMKILDVINWWYETFGEPSSLDSDIRTALFCSVIGALHLNDGHFYWVYGANPSGNYLTAVINTIYNSLFFRYVYYKSAAEAQFDYMSFPFSKTVSFMASGDDNIMGVHEKVHSFFNPLEVEKQAALIGMKYTSEAKGAVISVFRPLKEVSFLQRDFVFDSQEAMWLGPLNIDTVLNAPNWTWTDVRQNELKMSVECAIRELALHIEPVFKKWKAVLLKAASKCNYGILQTYSFSVYRNLMLRNAALNYALNLDVEKECKVQHSDEMPDFYKRPRFGKVLAQCHSGSSTLLVSKPTQKPPLEFCSHKGLRDLYDTYGNNCITETTNPPGPLSMIDYTEIVTFSEMTAETTNELLDREPLDVSLATHDDPIDYSIVSFLSRPKNITSGTIATTDTQGDQLFTLAFPQVFFDNNINCCKVSHVRFWKMDFEVEVKFNCPATTAGAVIFFWQPVPSLRGNFFVNANANAYTGLPHVIVDYNTTSNTKFVLPFVFHHAWWDIINDQSLSVVELTMAVLNDLNGVVGTDLVKYDVYAKCINIEMGVPTYYELAPIPSAFVDKTKERKEQGKLTDAGRVRYKPKFKGQMNEAVQRAQKGVETGISVGKTVGDVLDTTGKLMAQSGGAASWLADIATSLVPFGFCSPTDAEKAKPVYILPLANMSGHNGTSQAYTLGYDCHNSIDIDRRFFGTQQDEMNIAYAISRRELLDTVSWLKTQVKGTVLWTAPVTPGFCANSTSNTAVRASHNAFIAAMHELWAGSMIYTIQVIATGFHSGRLCICFAPGVFSFSGTITPEFTQPLPRLVIDVQGSVTKEFQVQFLSATPFLEVFVASPTSTGINFNMSDLEDPTCSTGSVVLFVENPLVGNSTVASSIDINIYVQGGPDMNFQIPSCPRYVPQANPGPSPLTDAHFRGVKCKGQMISDKVPPLTNKKTGDLSATHKISAGKVDAKKNLVKSRKVIGDFSGANLRPYTRIPTLIVDGDDLLNGQVLKLDSAWFDTYNETITKSRVDRIAMMYAFYRGGFEYIFVPTSVGTSQNETFFLQCTYDNSYPAVAPGSVAFTASAQGFVQEVARDVTPFIPISIPFYQGTQLMGIISDTIAAHRPIVTIQYVNAANVAYSLYRRARDDWDAGYMVECPNLRPYQ